MNNSSDLFARLKASTNPRSAWRTQTIDSLFTEQRGCTIMASASAADFGEEPGTSDIVFSPPVSEQRYQAAVDLAKKFKPKKVIDMGCGSSSLIRRLKWHHCIHELIGVDVDGDLLASHVNVGRPIMAEYLQPREHPFTIRLYQGSISEADQRLLDSDLLICIEVIEHLYEDVLSCVPSIIFGALRPKLAFFTTPNSDFNVLFNDKTRQFRHPDHKFEWSRQEFKDWCSGVCRTYPYAVEYIGMGVGPPGTEEYGCCSQGAIFTLLEGKMTNVDAENQVTSQPYKLISEIVYPHKEEDEVPLEERVHWEIDSCIHEIFRSRPDDITSYDDDEGRVYIIPLDMLLEFSGLRKLCSEDVEVLRSTISASSKLTLSPDGSSLLYREGEESDNSSHSSYSSSYSDDDLSAPRIEQQEEDWDAG